MVTLTYNIESNFRCSTLCGIPGVFMDGEKQDWIMLREKTLNLQTLLQPILGEIQLISWFESSLKILDKLIETSSG